MGLIAKYYQRRTPLRGGGVGGGADRNSKCPVVSSHGGHKGAGDRGSDWKGSCPLLPLITECTVLLYKTEITLSQLQIILHAATYSLSRLKMLVVRFSLVYTLHINTPYIHTLQVPTLAYTPTPYTHRPYTPGRPALRTKFKCCRYGERIVPFNLTCQSS